MAVKKKGMLGVMCEKHEGTDCEDGALTLIGKGSRGVGCTIRGIACY
jgi:hypothetical protein